MGRFLIGVGLLLALLLSCLGVSLFAQNVHETVCDDLESAAQLALSGNGESSLALVQQARAHWQDRWHQTAAFSEHEPMDEIDSLFAQLESYGKSGDLIPMAALCARLTQLIEAISDAQILHWWNLL